MSPSDPRHGTTRGHHAGCREACCRAAINAYEKRTRYRRARGIVWAIPALGIQRRIQALMALGWDASAIAADAGFGNRNQVWMILKGQKGKPCRWVERKTWKAVCESYERLSMRLPQPTTVRKKVVITRTRNLAVKNGWPPPLAWEDIDNPDEEPKGWARTTKPTRADILTDLDDQGAGISRACAELKVSPSALERWCERHDMNDVYARLKSREDAGRTYRNQWSREAS